jgi:cytochrome c oxidase subunit 4
MSQIKTYSIIFALLMVFSTAQALIEVTGALEAAYWIAFAGIMVISTVKAVMVAGWFQHLRYEPRSVTYLTATALIVVLALTTAAAYSIL